MWTAEQLRAINEDGNLLVSAAAGAGKTAVMTERIARIIASGTDVSEILVVTFTNPAAAEMKQRIERRFSRPLGANDDSKKKMHLHDSAKNISTSKISNIYNFFWKVLRRNFHLVGLFSAFTNPRAAEAAFLLSLLNNQKGNYPQTELLTGMHILTENSFFQLQPVLNPRISDVI